MPSIRIRCVGARRLNWSAPITRSTIRTCAAASSNSLEHWQAESSGRDIATLRRQGALRTDARKGYVNTYAPLHLRLLTKGELLASRDFVCTSESVSQG